MLDINELDNEMKRMDEFFDQITDSQFEMMAIEAGIGYIKNSCESNYVKATMMPLVDLDIKKTYKSDSKIKISDSCNMSWSNKYSLIKGAA
ncbi:hypothetical protein [Anaerosporobacter faecicola]|uniref:hypothetical protein n=1 Tax=Anaerosporobacter faecicola TaxID=2718714 RepID=UPI0014396D8E|nr:hypothetical protein [Anaerosporobacter faecicola]